MAQPTSSQIHIDAPLTNISVAYLQNARNFIADKVFPSIPVMKQSDKYFIFDKANFFKDHMQKRAAGEESAGSGYTVSNDNYFCDVYGLHKDISDFDRANTDSPLAPDRNAVQYLTQQALIRKDVQWAADYFTTGVWATDSTPGNLWSSYTTSDPIGDVDTGKTTILTSTGQEANTLVLGLQVFNQLKNHPDIVDRIKYTSSRVVTEDVLASLFGLDRVLVAKSIVDQTSEGKTASPALIHGKHALLCHVPASPGLETPAAGYTFNWTGIAPGFSGNGVVVSKLRNDLTMCDRIEAHCAFDFKATGTDLGYFFASVVA